MIPVGLIFNFIVLILLSWVFIHVMAAFGIFLAFSYLILWFFIPDEIPAFLGNLFAGKHIRGAFETNPENFLSALGNFFLIILISLFCLGLVWVETQLILGRSILNFPIGKKTAYFSIPPKGQYRLEEIFPMKIELMNLKIPINAVQVDVGYNPNRLEIVEVSTNDSFANVFIQKEIDNEAGYARLTGGVPNPGYQGDRGLFATFYFKGISPGLAEVEFLPTSLVLANDGQGSNVLSKLSKASFLVLPEKISGEQQGQQQVMFEARVLGETEEKTQLKFYEEGRILGQQQIKEETSLLSKLLWGLKSFNELILSFWQNVFTLKIFK